jgi:NAD(P)-dependent dehydrogenase (short-subunit alcohol dehydrogenase family)
LRSGPRNSAYFLIKKAVLINNAAYAAIPKSDNSDLRKVYADTFNTNIASVAFTTNHFLPLLKLSPFPQVINISSGRASVAWVTSGKNPPTGSIPYSISKMALNMMTYEMALLEPEVKYYVVSPGHCKTGLNGFRGPKDPVDGARVAVELVCAEKGVYAGGFWEYEEAEMRVVPW